MVEEDPDPRLGLSTSEASKVTASLRQVETDKTLSN